MGHRSFLHGRADGRTALLGAASTLALALAMELAAGTAAEAACTPAAANNVTATCTGVTVNQNGTSGYGSGGETGVTVEVAPGARVEGTNFGMLFFSASVTNNAGSVITGSVGLATNGALAAVNSGTIIGTGNSGVFAGGGLTLTNAAGASITGVVGVRVTGDATILNSGTIDGTTNWGVFTTGSANVTNTAGAVIRGTTGIAAAGDAIVVNSGIITGTADFGVVADTAAITNNAGATITGASNGIFLSAGGSSIFNAGIVTGGTTAISFAGTGNTLTLAPGSVIGGNVIGGTGNALRLGGASGADTFDFAQLSSGNSLKYRNFATLEKIDGATWTVTGSGSAFTGAVTVSGGLLAVNGDISTASGVTVNAGGTLGGTGVLPSTVINSGGVLAPGNSIGTINIAGPLTFGAGSIYRVEVNAAGQSDRVIATGAATLNGGTVQVVAAPGTYNTSTSYTILQAASVTGRFADVISSSIFLTPSLTYGVTDVTLTLIRNANAFASVGQTFNQRAVGGALDAAPSGALVQAILPLGAAQARYAYDQLSGEVHASVAGALIDESLQVRSAILGRLRQSSFADAPGLAALSLGGPATAFAAEGDPMLALAYAGPTKAPFPTKAAPLAPAVHSDLVFWAQGFGAWGRFDGDGNAATLKRDLAGVVTGVDTRVGTTGRFGLAAGYTGSRNTTEGRGSADVDSGHMAAYGGWGLGALALRGGAAFAVHTIDTDRSILFTGFADRARADYQATTGQVFGEVGWGTRVGTVAVEPFAGAAWIHWGTTGFREAGGAAALAGGSNSVEVGTTTLGLRAATTVLLGDRILVPRASLAWQHAYGDVTPALGLSFQSTGAGFTVAGVPIAQDALLAEAGLDLVLSPNASIGVSYAGQIADNVQDHSAKGRFAWRF